MECKDPMSVCSDKPPQNMKFTMETNNFPVEADYLWVNMDCPGFLSILCGYF